MAPKHSKFPDPNDWSKVAPNLGSWSRKIFVSLPCVGIDGAGFALKTLKVPFHANNVFDLEHRYQAHLEEHLSDSSLHLGRESGDICKADFAKIERPCEVLISGPPCPPWAGNGSHNGQDDCRADVFLTIMKLVLSFIKTGELKACVLENVRGILHKKNGQPSFMDNMISFLREHASEFDWNVVTLKAEDYMLPQQRTRVFLRGLRKTLGKGEVPKPLDPFGKRRLVDFLDHSLPHVDKSTLTDVMRKNLLDGVKALEAMVTKGDLLSGDVAVWPLDRAEGKIYKRRFSQNIVPTLTTTNKYLFISSLEGPEKDRKFFRFLSPTERMLLQGFHGSTLADTSEALRIKGSGNAYPVPLMIAALAPLLKEIKKGLGVKPSSHQSLLIKDAKDVCKSFDEFMEGCRVASSKKRKGKKRPAAMKKRAAKPKAAMKKSKAKSSKGTGLKPKARSAKRKHPARKKTELGHRSKSRYRWIGSSSS